MGDDYPSLLQMVGSVREATFNTVMDQAESGKARLRSFFSKDWGIWKLQHECRVADRDTLLNHYAVNRDLPFNFTFAGDGQVYVVMYGEYPQVNPTEDMFLWKIEVTLIEV